MLREKENKVNITPDDIREENLTGESKESRMANVPAKVLAATSIIEDEVKNFEGKSIGSIKNIMLNLKSGCVEYIVLEFGGFLGFGEKLFAIPFNALHLDPKEQIFLLDIDKKKLESAPGFDVEHWPETNSEHWKDVDGYWDIQKHQFHKKFI